MTVRIREAPIYTRGELVRKIKGLSEKAREAYEYFLPIAKDLEEMEFGEEVVGRAACAAYSRALELEREIQTRVERARRGLPWFPERLRRLRESLEEGDEGDTTITEQSSMLGGSAQRRDAA